MSSKQTSVLEDTKQTALHQLIKQLKSEIDYCNYLLSKEDYKAYHIGIKGKKTQAKSTLNDAESLLGIEKQQIEDAWWNGWENGNVPNSLADGIQEQYYQETYEK
jgi:hypothetical protein